MRRVVLFATLWWVLIEGLSSQTAINYEPSEHKVPKGWDISHFARSPLIPESTFVEDWDRQDVVLALESPSSLSRSCASNVLMFIFIVSNLLSML